MKFVILICFTLLFYVAVQNGRNLQAKTYLPLSVSPLKFSATNYSMYQAMLTGNKTQVPRKVKNIFKKYGFIHLLTPSGIHLSSVVLLVSFSKVLELLFLIGIFISIFPSTSYHSLERVIIFRFLYKLAKSILPQKYNSLEAIFISTFIISLLIGHFTLNPLSFIFSFVFWGTVLISRKSKLLLMFRLNYVLFLMGSLAGGTNSPLSFLINPIVTAIVSLFFPLLVINNFLPTSLNFDTYVNDLLSIFLDSIQFISRYDPFPSVYYSTTLLLIGLVLITHKKYKVFICLLCLSPQATPIQGVASNSPRVVNIGDSSELLRRKNDRLYFIDQACSIRELRILCKKKPSAWGGPNI